jgi:hypothetical protein
MMCLAITLRSLPGSQLAELALRRTLQLCSQDSRLGFRSQNAELLRQSL